jgi:hypothetical protein
VVVLLMLLVLLSSTEHLLEELKLSLSSGCED